jgi:transcriptional regulator with XRE-family HTH domain
MPAIQNHLKSLRKARKLAQAAIAVEADTTPNMLVNIERYGYLPSEAVQQRIAEVLGVAVTDIWPHLVNGHEPEAEPHDPA